MDCSDFMAGFSDYYDRRADADEVQAMEGHLAACPSCRRYHAVVTRGGQMLRGLPEPAVREDFRPRLQHRIYHIEDETALARSAASGTTGATAIAMAVLLTVAAWTPLVTDASPGEADAAAQAAEAGSDVPAGAVSAPGPVVSPASLFQPPPSLRQRDLLERPAPPAHTHSLLYEYSALSARYRRAAELRRTGLQ